MLRLIIAVILAMFCMVSNASSQKPNVLLIVLDDAGYSDFGTFGRGDAPTPTLNELAQHGVSFTHHYADSTCRPARIAILTGREAGRVTQNPDFRGIPTEITTLPEVLKQAGYSTHHIGKWHVGDSVRESWPDKQGFDTWFGFLNQFQLKGPDKNGRFSRRPTYINPWLQSDSSPLKQYQGHLEDLLAQKVIETIDERAKQSKPWFINYWLFAPHHPSIASDEYLKQFPPTKEGKYRALLAQADAEIGKVFEELHKTGQWDNTLILVTSDNGGTNEMMNNNYPYAGIKGGFQEGSLRTPLIIRWPYDQYAGKQIDTIVALQDLFPTILAAADIKHVLNKTENPFDGQDLQPLLENKTIFGRELVHEIFTIGNENFGLLTEDGKWRLTGDALYDLVNDPDSAINVSNKFPQQKNVLQQHYEQWRIQKSPLDVQYTIINTNGVAQISGDSLRRAPGYGAFSMAIGVQGPKKPPEQLLYLVDQQGVWSLAYTPHNTLLLKIGDDVIESEKIPDSFQQHECTSVILSSMFSRSRLHEGHDYGTAQLYAGQTKVLDWQKDKPTENTENFSEPTYVGQRSDGSGKWPAYLQKPLLFNSALPILDQGNLHAMDIQEAARQACSANEKTFSESMLKRFYTLPLLNPIEWHGNPYDYFSDKKEILNSVPSGTVCAIKYNDTKTAYGLFTYKSESEAHAAGAFVTHYGQCGTCSTLHDLSVYIRNRDLTTPVRRCGVMSPIKSLTMSCLKDIGFTDACAETWYYNAKYTAKQCLSTCIVSWLKNEPSNDANGNLNKCLECDETQSGPVFKYVAGRTRRNSGIVSSIDRKSEEVKKIDHDY